MKLLELNIEEFGGLRGRKILPGEGLNLIAGENESGKSTCYLFIKFMLYGFPRKTAGNTDRERSVSFGGHRAAGSLRLMQDGKEYRIERSFIRHGERKNSEAVRVFCCDDGQEVFAGEVPGEALLGVSREIFESTCGVGQESCTELGGDRVAERIGNMLTAADENTDVIKALKKLDAARRDFRLKSGSGGRIEALSRELEETEKRLAEARRNAGELSELNERYEELSARYREAVERRDRAAEIETQSSRIQLLRQFERLHESEKNLKQAEEDRKKLCSETLKTERIPDRAYLDAINFRKERLTEEEKKQDACREQYERQAALASQPSARAEVAQRVEKEGGSEAVLRQENGFLRKIKKFTTLGALSIALAVLGAVLAVLGRQIPAVPGWLSYVGAGIAVAGLSGAVLLFVRRAGVRAGYGKLCRAYLPDGVSGGLAGYLAGCADELSRFREQQTKLDFAGQALTAAEQSCQKAYSDLCTCLAECGYSLPEQGWQAAFRKIHDELSVFCSKYEFTLARQNRLEPAVRDLRDSLKGYDEEDLRGAVSGEAEKADEETVRRAGADREKYRQMAEVLDGERQKCAHRRTELLTVSEDPVALADRVETLREELAEATDICEALVLAHSTLTGADEHIRSHISPLLGRRAGELLEKVTGGRYREMHTGDRLDIALSADGSPVMADLLSGGTRDMAYLLLRIALIEQIYGKELPPLILDEALCQLDEKRTEAILRVLAELAGDGLQILLFTCHRREGQILSACGLPYTEIELV